jgi:folylpolyglutamate synthase
MIPKIQRLTGRSAKSLSMEYTVRQLSSPTLPMLIVQDALEKLRNLRCLRQQLDTRPKSSSGRVRTQGWIDILGVDVTNSSSSLLACILRFYQIQSVKFIHVAGTKGKGSTCLYCERILSAYQKASSVPKKIGCLTSPHLTNTRERIRINASPISRRLFASYFFELWEKIKSNLVEHTAGPSLPGYPGFLVLLALYIFVKQGVEVAIVETGVGGENDSTNVIPCPTATGITTIGRDHTEVLGNDLRSIAWHKSGIFKQHSPAYTVEQESSVLTVLRKRAEEKRTLGTLVVVPENLVTKYSVTVSPDMPFQRQNASLAIVLAETYLRSLDPSFEMTQDLAMNIERTELPGRSQVLRRGEMEWYISSAHNELSAEVASAWYKCAVKSSG